MPRDINATRDRLAGNIVTDSLTFHVHGFNYFEGKLFVPYPACRLYIIDALTGKEVRVIRDMCANIPGNAPARPNVGYKPQQAYGPVFYAKERVMIVPAGAITESNEGARGFFAGYNIDTGQLLWRFFVVPPSGGDSDWAIRDANKGWIEGVKTSDILVKCRQCLENDWGRAGRDGGQAGPGWGQWAVDVETGIVFLATAQPAPDFNATYRPGPNLFSSSVVALDAKTGELKWYHQTSTHDLWDYDCAWNTTLGNIGARKVVYKGCKNGIEYAFDAATGEMIWYFNDPNIKRSEWTPWHSGSLLPSGPKDNSPIGAWDPADIRTMTRRWLNEPATGPVWLNPPANGGIEADQALAYGTVYVGTYNAPAWIRPNNVAPAGAGGGPAAGTPPYTQRPNATIRALDAATGKARWGFTIDGVGFRGGLLVSGGVLYVPGQDGTLYALDADTGKELTRKYLGVPLAVAPTIGADGSGKMRIFVTFGQNFIGIGQPLPGSLLAFGLPDKLPEPQIITKEVIREVPKEVVKEVIKEVPKEVIKEVVKEVPKEVIKEVPKEVIKEVPKEVTKTVTVETISPTTYVVLGVAVVIAVVGIVVGMRGRKRAS